LKDGRILYAGKQLWLENPRVGVSVSHDDGQTWQWLAEIPARDGDDPKAYHELHVVEAENGDLITHIRNHNEEHPLLCQKTWQPQTERRNKCDQQQRD